MMRSVSGGNKQISAAPSRSSKSSATCSYPSPFPPPNDDKSMEDIWKDISLSTLHQPTTPASSAANTADAVRPPPFHGEILQDFCSRPFGRHLLPIQPSGALGVPPSAAGAGISGSPAATVLSLNSADPSKKNSSACRKRAPENDDDDDERHKRMIKNRESAARSRARKQASTFETSLAITGFSMCVFRLLLSFQKSTHYGEPQQHHFKKASNHAAGKKKQKALPAEPPRTYVRAQYVLEYGGITNLGSGFPDLPVEDETVFDEE
ncbi:hypothetical protein RJ639_026276 [Escallonia herrerae]|uniref:BZIP domain-containing protein n=1 Tax=Escallonia herrerae TaxID=1293975 RepID=A0AA88SCS5_9ASTE|nr:hypothetical protein RJ639_026276 [Escallonia herrerae]